ncbi:hypothetical protein [Lyngbya aestuarii]|uniref:hypothetical protein n=1 Tax=Lyngbya aestuarii TaxID=118322 RepID=UPI00403D75B9
MQQFFSVIKQVFHKSILVISLTSLLSLSGLLVFTNQAALALPDTNLNTLSQTKLTDTELGVKDPEAVYEEETKEIRQNPKGATEEMYEEEYKEYKKSQPNQGLVENAKELVEDVTGKK